MDGQFNSLLVRASSISPPSVINSAPLASYESTHTTMDVFIFWSPAIITFHCFQLSFTWLCMTDPFLFLFGVCVAQQNARENVCLRERKAVACNPGAICNQHYLPLLSCQTSADVRRERDMLQPDAFQNFTECSVYMAPKFWAGEANKGNTAGIPSDTMTSWAF